jgi:hypothetical protein
MIDILCVRSVCLNLFHSNIHVTKRNKQLLAHTRMDFIFFDEYFFEIWDFDMNV